jgi:hypothetical protein
VGDGLANEMNGNEHDKELEEEGDKKWKREWRGREDKK